MYPQHALLQCSTSTSRARRLHGTACNSAWMCPASHVTACMHILVMRALSRCCVRDACLLRRIAVMGKPFNSPDTLICISCHGRGSADCDAQSEQQNLAGVFVSPSGSAAPCGLDWGAPCAKLSDGIATAATNSISQIWVAPGALSADESQGLALRLCTRCCKGHIRETQGSGVMESCHFLKRHAVERKAPVHAMQPDGCKQVTPHSSGGCVDVEA